MHIKIVNSLTINHIKLFVRKMSTDCFKGIPLDEVYRGREVWSFEHLPPIANKRDHIVLFQLPFAENATNPPKPHIGETRWDANHVRLPCATQNEYKTESLSDPSRQITTTRWEIIQTSLLRNIRTSRELEQAILTYNHKYAKEWKFKALHALFEKDLDQSESEVFFTKILPNIIQLALQLPDIIQSAIPLLKHGQNKSISLSQKQIACLLANAFLCTFPRRNDFKNGAEYASYPSINFNSLFQSVGDQNVEKIKCICNYFRRVCHKMPTGVVTFARRCVSVENLPKWDECQATFADSLLHVSNDGTIEDDGEGLLQVDFANKFLGGGVLNYGCVQEEIRFMICPELLVSRLFTEYLWENECMTIVGCEQFNCYQGYASTFMWTGDMLDQTPYDSSQRRKCAIVAIDAIPFRNKTQQYKEDMLKRELNKAYIGFKYDLPTPVPGVATGNWGCGAFNGNKHLKSLLQLMACCITKRPLVYYTFGDVALRDELFMIYEYLSKNKVKIAELWACLRRYAEQKSVDHLYEFIIVCHQESRECKSSNNGQSSTQANRSDHENPAKSERNQTTIPSSTNSTKTPPSPSSDQYNIENSDDEDDQFTIAEVIKLQEKSVTEQRITIKQKPKPLIGKSLPLAKTTPTTSRTIQQFFQSSSTTSELQEKRPRSSLLECLDEDFHQKSPAKIKRSADRVKKVAIPIKNCELNQTQDKTAVEFDGDEYVDQKKDSDASSPLNASMCDQNLNSSLDLDCNDSMPDYNFENILSDIESVIGNERKSTSSRSTSGVSDVNEESMYETATSERLNQSEDIFEDVENESQTEEIVSEEKKNESSKCMPGKNRSRSMFENYFIKSTRCSDLDYRQKGTVSKTSSDLSSTSDASEEQCNEHNSASIDNHIEGKESNFDLNTEANQLKALHVASDNSAGEIEESVQSNAMPECKMSKYDTKNELKELKE